MHKSQKKIDSPIGQLFLVATDQGLCGVHWNQQKIDNQNVESTLQKKILNKAEMQLAEYFSGKRKKFDVPLDLHGTDFQIQVWQQLQKIPYGETRSYKNIAFGIDNVKACRAVGTANGKNPVSIIIPCHRVINEDGQLGGYAGGLQIKKYLLKLENII